MGRLVLCQWEGRTLTIDEALALRSQRSASSLQFFCLDCGQRVRAHKAGTTGQGAHFEHLVRNPLCLGGSKPIEPAQRTPHSVQTLQKNQLVTKAPQAVQFKWPRGMPKLEPRQDFSEIQSLLPPRCGHREFKSTLCIGLDIALFGGSKGNSDSQFDCVVSAVVAPDPKATVIDIQRVSLVGRDLDASITARAIGVCIDRYAAKVDRIVLGIDAPLLSTQVIPPGRERAWRASDRVLSDTRSAIDRFLGGSQGWHPTLQPGAPLAPRVASLVETLSNQHGFEVWKRANEQSARLAIEVFPSEAIWSLKRLGGYAEHQNADLIRSYKKLKGVALQEEEVRHLVQGVLSSVGTLIGFEEGWEMILESSLGWMLADPTWNQNGLYRGGKLLDDVIDSLLCLAAAISYAKGESHVYANHTHLDDGHIIGPGVF